MTFAPQTLVNFQARCTSELGTTNLGISGDRVHVATGGYHIGAMTLRANGMSGDYSLEFAPDHSDTSDRACAVDLGGTPELLMTLGNRLVHALKNRDPRVYKRIRATNAPFDGVSDDRRYDCEDPSTPVDDNCQVSSDRNHIHIEFYRTLVTSQDVMDGLFDVLAGIGEDDMSAADVKAINEHTDAQIAKVISAVKNSQEHALAGIYQKLGLVLRGDPTHPDSLKALHDELDKVLAAKGGTTPGGA